MPTANHEARRWIEEKAYQKGKSLSEHATVGEINEMADEMTDLDGPLANKKIQEGLQSACYDSKKNSALRGLMRGVRHQLEA